MKIKSSIYIVLLTGILLTLLFSCKKEATNTAPTVPSVTISTVTVISENSVISHGEVTSDGGSAVTSRGVCWSTNQNPTTSDSKTIDGTGTGSFTSTIMGLTPGAIYYIRAYATNSIGTAYGEQTTYTIVNYPALTTNTISATTATTAKSGGNITSDGGSAVTARGVCWSTTQLPTTANSKTTDGSGIGSFESSLTGLVENTTYYVRAYATNSAGTGYGSEVSFKASALTVTDIDGNVYHTVTIGTQVWMVENLKTTKYRNGDPMPNVTDLATWKTINSGAYCWYNNDAATYKATYGALYNWYSVSDSRNIAPTGWHVATDAEWTTLITFLGGKEVAGGKLKETGTSHWLSPNTNAANSNGFTALPGGYLNSYDGNGTFSSIGTYGIWFSSTEHSTTEARIHEVKNDNGRCAPGEAEKGHGFSVRCVKD